ncbi:MAG: hypothetical protein M1818_000081 [Claussenomyces sp. TS43310]|nr:MAG: hypothetical protein M1818_000081 [Claussenomyces sp. TS43310]
MEEELARLRRKLAQAEARALEEQQKSRLAEGRAAVEQQRREEEQRRREAAEADSQQSQLKNFIEYLEACHSFSNTLEVVTDATLTTQGDTTKPAGRPFPQRILPWTNFAALQERVWEKLSTSELFTSQRVYPSTHQLQYVQKYLDPISSELGLRHHARETVENPVRTLIGEVHKDEGLRERLQLQGPMMFESHTNLPQPRETSIEEEIEHISISEPQTSQVEDRRAKKKKSKQAGKQGSVSNSGRRRAGSADQFCIYEMSDGQRIPVVSIEYKPPHKLPLAQIVAGLRGEIHPAEEVINQDGDDFVFLSKSLLAAVVTQLFSYMIRKGIRWGYIFVGEAIIFLYIPDDPATVLYHLSIPRLDFQDDDENRFHRTSVAQIFAFFLNSLSTESPSQAWRDKAATLDTWDVEYSDILKKIPETERKDPREISYKPGRWKGFIRSPIRTRSRGAEATCKKPVDDEGHKSDSESDDNNSPPTPTPRRTGADAGERSRPAPARRGVRNNQRTKDASSQDEMEAASKPRIEDRPFCTSQCLLGLAHGGDLDDQCPNIRDHQGGHIAPGTFLSLIRVQLANDRGRDADCKTLHIVGSRGALFKVRLTSHGYTLVAKGMEKADRSHLINESKVYNHLRSIQGIYIPVSLGLVDLELPQRYDGGIYDSMLFLSWAGRSICQHLTLRNKAQMLDRATETLQALHELRVLHTDVELRNWLWDEQRGNLMLVDFERAQIRVRPALDIISPNRKRTRRGEMKYVRNDHEFDREIRSARGSISQYIR